MPTDDSDKTSAGKPPRRKTTRKSTHGADAAKAATADIEKTLAGQLEELEELVREHPLATVGIAAGLGVVAGLILSRH